MAEAAGRVESACESCGARVVVEPLARTARCPYCDSPAVVDRPATADRPDPAFAIGFPVDRDRAGNLVRSFLRRRKLAPFGLERAAPEKVEGVYVPAYLLAATRRGGPGCGANGRPRSAISKGRTGPISEMSW